MKGHTDEHRQPCVVGGLGDIAHLLGSVDSDAAKGRRAGISGSASTALGVHVSEDESVEASQVHVMDPWNGDRWLPFNDFENQYEMAGTNWGNNVYRR